MDKRARNGKAHQNGTTEPLPAILPNAEFLLPEHRPRGRNIDEDTVLFMAQVIGARKLKDEEACLLCGIKERTWRKWLSRERNSDRFRDALTRVRAATINRYLGTMDDAGHGRNGHRPDWRAHDRLLVHLDRDRFGDDKGGVNVQVAVFNEESTNTATAKALAQAAALGYASPASLPPASQPASLPALPCVPGATTGGVPPGDGDGDNPQAAQSQ